MANNLRTLHGMEFEEKIDWGEFNINMEQESDWCLTEELFDRFSLGTALYEQEEKVPEKQAYSPFPEPRTPFLRISNLSIEDQKYFLETYKDYIGGKEISFENVHRLQDLMWTLNAEHEEFSTFLQQHSVLLKDEYNFVHPQVKASVQKLLINQRSRVQRLAPCYTLFQTVGLSSGAVFPNDPILRFDRLVKQAVGQTLLRLPNLEGRIQLLQDQILDEGLLANYIELCQDSSVRDISAQHSVHFVLTAGALQTLIDNHQPEYDKEWQLPLTVVELPNDGCKSTSCPITILIDDPLPPKSITPREVNVLFYKHEVCELLKGASESHGANCVEQANLSNSPDNEGLSTIMNTLLASTSYDSKSTPRLLQNPSSSTQSKRKASGELEINRQNCFENTKQNTGCFTDRNDRGNIQVTFSHREGEKVGPSSVVSSKYNDSKNKQDVNMVNFSYSLWTFGNLKLLIRSTDNGLLYQSKKGEKGSLHPVNVFVKPEYQLMFGYEQVTPSEASRMWISSYINPDSLCICARVDPVACELVRLDVLSQAAIINLSSFNAAQPMKMIHNVLTSLLKLLEPGKFISSHSSRDMHTCIYEMMSGGQIDCKNASYDLHSVYSGGEEFLKNYEKSLPWVSIDPNMFLDWHIAHDRLPMTFPAVSSDELKKKTGSLVEKKKKKNKNKKNKSIERKTGGLTMTKEYTNPKVLNLKSNDKRKRLRNLSKLIDTDRPLCETASERLRAKSMPMTYNDIDFDF